MGLRKAMAQLLRQFAPEDPDEMRMLLGRIDEALERSTFGIRNAHQDDTAWELMQLRKKLRSRRADLIAKLQERVEHAG